MNQNHPTRGQAMADPSLSERLEQDLDQAVARTLRLVDEHAGQAIADGRPLRQHEKTAMLSANAALLRPAVTSADLLDMIQPDAKWFDPETLEEGLQNHTSYHAGRPGECGSSCPGLLTLPAPEETP